VSDARAAAQETVRRLAALPPDTAVTPGLVLREVARMASPTAELVPWVGPSLVDQVTRARRLLRPGDAQQVPCSLAQLRAGSQAVRRAQDLAREHGVALLVADADPEQEESARAAAAELIALRDGDRRVVLLGRSMAKGRGGVRRSRLELLVVREDGT
jgi:hypothetical protein